MFIAVHFSKRQNVHFGHIWEHKSTGVKMHTNSSFTMFQLTSRVLPTHIPPVVAIFWSLHS